MPRRCTRALPSLSILYPLAVGSLSQNHPSIGRFLTGFWLCVPVDESSAALANLVVIDKLGMSCVYPHQRIMATALGRFLLFDSVLFDTVHTVIGHVDGRKHHCCPSYHVRNDGLFFV